MTKTRTRPAPGQLVLVRHGQSDWNHKNLFTGWTDVDLTAQGRDEAHAAGRALADAGITFDIAFTRCSSARSERCGSSSTRWTCMWIPVENTGA